tara:strand:+ start:227 stop:778 length:552 start_codon:yes stop_codon:yes gene_type:complete
MRIISGKFKGKKIYLPKDNLTRPLRDMVKESIFNILKHSSLLKNSIEKAHILDLFSGTGSFGLECISRGAAHVTFFENYENALKVLMKNINNLNCSSRTKIYKENIFNADLNLLGKFDIIFLDPPFKYNNIGKLISSLIYKNILKKNGIIVLHKHKNDVDNFPKEFKIIKQINHGISKIYFGN